MVASFISRVLRLALLFMSFHAVLSRDASGQSRSTVPKGVLSASFRYQQLPDTWDIAFFGVTGDVRVTDQVSFSGSFFLGEGSDDRLYAHLPMAGMVAAFSAMLPFALVHWLEAQSGEETEPFIPPIFWKLLMMENVHYNIRAGDALVVSPYVSLLSLDGTVIASSGTQDPNTEDGFGMLSTGVGLSIKILPSGHLVLTPDVSAKRFFVFGDPAYGNDDRFGYTLTLHVGYAF
jgi:hypothetical protein